MFKTIPAVSLGSSRRCARDEFSLSSFSALAEDELKLLVSCQTDKHSYTFSLPLHDDSFLKFGVAPGPCPVCLILMGLQLLQEHVPGIDYWV